MTYVRGDPGEITRVQSTQKITDCRSIPQVLRARTYIYYTCTYVYVRTCDIYMQATFIFDNPYHRP